MTETPSAIEPTYTPPTAAAPEAVGSYSTPTASAPGAVDSYSAPTATAPEAVDTYSAPSASAPGAVGSYSAPSATAPEPVDSYAAPTASAPGAVGSYSPPTASAPGAVDSYSPPTASAPGAVSVYTPPAETPWFEITDADVQGESAAATIGRYVYAGRWESYNFSPVFARDDTDIVIDDDGILTGTGRIFICLPMSPALLWYCMDVQAMTSPGEIFAATESVAVDTDMPTTLPPDSWSMMNSDPVALVYGESGSGVVAPLPILP